MTAFSWDSLADYKTGGRFLDGYPDVMRTFFSPQDGPGIHRLLVDLPSSASFSVLVDMFGFDDPEINDALKAKTLDPHVYFQGTFDSSQYGSKTESGLLGEWNHDAIGTSIAIGRSSKGAISHDKNMIVDGLYVVTGSTNWSLGGEEKQDNTLVIIKSAVVAAEYTAVANIIHTEMLKQMHAKALAAAKTVPK